MEQNKSSIGSIISIIIIITVIILGGLYFWGKRIEDAKYKEKIISENAMGADTATVNEAAAIKSITPGDDVNSIQADLDKTNLNNLSVELDQPVQ